MEKNYSRAFNFCYVNTVLLDNGVLDCNFYVQVFDKGNNSGKVWIDRNNLFRISDRDFGLVFVSLDPRIPVHILDSMEVWFNGNVNCHFYVAVNDLGLKV